MTSETLGEVLQDMGTFVFENITHGDAVSAIDKVMGAGAPSYALDVPHQMILLFPGGKFCGASIIHPLLLLTAAHCFALTGPDPTSLRVATAAQIDQGFFRGESQVSPNVSSIVVHPKFNKTAYMENDIALVTLRTWIQLDNNATKSIKIPKPEQMLSSGTAIVSGYGGTANSYKRQSQLRAVEVPFVDRETCKNIWTNTTWKRSHNKVVVVTDNMLCAGDLDRDACAGDSGGPLTCKDRDGQEFLCGIVSFGSTCNFGHKRNADPGVYTDVSKYQEWIQKHIDIWWRYYFNLRYAQPLEDLDGNKSCGRDSFACEGIGSCVPKSHKCDGEHDCAPWDTSDERNCTAVTCAKGRFRCKTVKRCVPLAFCRDDDDDCGDGSDESDDCGPVPAA